MGSVKDLEAKKYKEDCKLLIKSVTSFNENEENFQTCVDFALSNLLYHTNLSTNSHQVIRRISGLHEKLLIHSRLDEAKHFKSVSDTLIRFFKDNTSQKDTGFGVLAFLLHLSVSSTCGVDPNGNKQKKLSIAPSEVSSRLDWTTYLREDDIDSNALSDIESDTLSEFSPHESSEDESLVDSPNSLQPPPRDDSGLGISPDSCSGVSQHFHPVATVPIISEERTERNLKTFYPYWVARYQKMFGRCPYDLKSMNFTKVWNDYLIRQYPYTLIEKKVVVHERNVIKEILWMMTGVDELFVVHWENNMFKPNVHVHLTNLTACTLQSALVEFCEYATRKANLERQLKSLLHESTNTCFTYQSYVQALQEQLYKINNTVCNLDRSLRKCDNVFTLLTLRARLKPVFDEIDLLCEIHEEVSEEMSHSVDIYLRAAYLLHTLWNHLLSRSVLEQSSQLLKLMLRVFLKSIRPYLNFMEELMILGSFKDSYEEFIIKRLDKPATDDEFWEAGLEIRTLPAPLDRDFFLKPFFNQILSAGKSLEILNAINLQAKKEPFRLHLEKGDLYAKFINIVSKSICMEKQYENRRESNKSTVLYTKTVSSNAIDSKKDSMLLKDPLLEQQIFSFNSATAKFFRPNVNPFYKTVLQKPLQNLFSDTQRNTSNLLDVMTPNTLKPLTSSITKALRISMQYAYNPTCQGLMKTLKQQHRLIAHLNVMRKYFLMESGDRMFSFYTAVFDQMILNQPWKDASFLYSALQNAISEDKDNCERLCVLLNLENPNINPKQPLSCLNALQLSYQLEWPVSIIITPKSHMQYCEIFSFLLQIKCAKYYLDELYCINLSHNGPRSRLSHLLLKSKHPREQKMHGMCIIRMRLLFFVNGLHNYIMTRILHSFGNEFCSIVEEAESIDELISSHKHYLKSLEERCLLDPRLLHLRAQIIQVLNLSYVFHRLWMKGVDRVHVNDLKVIEQELSKACNFLLCSLSAPLRRGTYAHLENLVSTMLSDTHSLHIFGERNT